MALNLKHAANVFVATLHCNHSTNFNSNSHIATNATPKKQDRRENTALNYFLFQGDEPVTSVLATRRRHAREKTTQHLSERIRHHVERIDERQRLTIPPNESMLFASTHNRRPHTAAQQQQIIKRDSRAHLSIRPMLQQLRRGEPQTQAEDNRFGL